MAIEGDMSAPAVLSLTSEPNWDGVFAEQLPRVYNYFRYRFGNDVVAEDLTSRTFEKAWRSRWRYRRDMAGFATWLLSIARNLAIDHWRAMREHVSLDAVEEMPSTSNPHDESARDSDLKRLAALVKGLSPREQEIVALKYGAETTNRAIAALLGLSESNVGTMLHRIVQTLRRDW